MFEPKDSLSALLSTEKLEWVVNKNGVTYKAILEVIYI